jgi:hypothetical protein
MLNASFRYFVGLAAICWALWRTRNNICFDKKSGQISYRDHLLSFLYLFGQNCAEVLRAAALNFHPREAQAEDTGMVLPR